MGGAPAGGCSACTVPVRCRGGFTPFGAQAIAARRSRGTALPWKCGPICRRRANAPPLRGGREFAGFPQESGPHFSLSRQRKVAAGAVEKKALYVPISAFGLIGGCDTGVLARWEFDGTMTLPEISLGEIIGPGHSRMHPAPVSACAAPVCWGTTGGYRIRPYVLHPSFRTPTAPSEARRESSRL
jgi:hypothetical protein